MQPPHLFDTSAMEWGESTQFPRLLIKPLETNATHPYARATLVRLPVGYTIPTHLHDVEIETIYVFSGNGVLCLGEHEVTVGAGQGGSVPVGLQHSLRNVGDSQLELLALHVRVVRAED